MQASDYLRFLRSRSCSPPPRFPLFSLGSTLVYAPGMVRDDDGGEAPIPSLALAGRPIASPAERAFSVSFCFFSSSPLCARWEKHDVGERVVVERHQLGTAAGAPIREKALPAETRHFFTFPPLSFFLRRKRLWCLDHAKTFSTQPANSAHAEKKAIFLFIFLSFLFSFSAAGSIHDTDEIEALIRAGRSGRNGSPSPFPPLLPHSLPTL